MPGLRPGPPSPSHYNGLFALQAPGEEGGLSGWGGGTHPGLIHGGDDGGADRAGVLVQPGDMMNGVISAGTTAAVRRKQ